MRFPAHLLQKSTYRSEPFMVAMAAVAVGIFVGTWVIGPAVTLNSADAPAPVARERTTFDAMVARPDPPPYRSPTPAFDMSGPPNYGAAARAKAQAEVGGQSFDYGQGAADESLVQPPSSSRRSSRAYPRFDQHRVY